MTEHAAPIRKVCETVGTPHLLVVGPYRMGFDISAAGSVSDLRVFIDYQLPDTALPRWLLEPLARAYARWCTRRMADDAARHFDRRH